MILTSFVLPGILNIPSTSIALFDIHLHVLSMTSNFGYGRTSLALGTEPSGRIFAFTRVSGVGLLLMKWFKNCRSLLIFTPLSCSLSTSAWESVPFGPTLRA